MAEMSTGSILSTGMERVGSVWGGGRIDNIDTVASIDKIGKRALAEGWGAVYN